MGETPNLKSDEQPVSAGALRVTCPHCGAHGEATDMLEQVRFDSADDAIPVAGSESVVVGAMAVGVLLPSPPTARFTCCGLWGDLAVAEPTPEDAT